MTVHLYLSLIPEALIASMLSPEEFGEYYTVGDTKKHSEQAMFVELDPNFRHDFFRIDEAFARCVPNAQGEPKKSVYIATYRVLEHIPLESIDKLYLSTRYGRTLGLNRVDAMPKDKEELYLYQEIAPVSLLVASTHDPVSFHQFLTQNPDTLIHLPSICFVDLRLDDLAKDPLHGQVGDLPYGYVPQLRDTLMDLKEKDILTKMVDRTHSVEYPYRVINSGIYLGNANGLIRFALPSLKELRSKYYMWWRSANM